MPVDFRIKDYAHPIALMHRRRALQKSQWFSKEELEAEQLKRLRILFAHVKPRIPYYRKAWADLDFNPAEISALDQLRQMPLLTKEELRENPESLLVEGTKLQPKAWITTSGTSGRPVRFVHDHHARALEFCYYWRHWGWAGFKLGDRFAELGSMHFVNRPNLNSQLFHWQTAIRRLMVNANKMRPDRITEIQQAFQKHRPRFLKGLASALQHLAQCFRAENIQPRQFQAVFSTGEVLTPTARKIIETCFGAPVLDSYGHMERTVAIAQCLKGSYHVQSDYGVLQFEGERKVDGRKLARVIGTSMYNRIMPLIRYEVGDEVELMNNSESCPCGRALPRVVAIHGRSEDIIQTPDGRWITAAFCLVETDDPVKAYQLHQERVNRVRMLIVPSLEWSAQDESRLRARAQAMLGEGMSVVIQTCRDADLVRSPTGKLRVVIGGKGA